MSVREARMEASDKLEEVSIRVCISLCTVRNPTRPVRFSHFF